MAKRETEKFTGFPPELFSFLAGLERDNSKSYWDAHTDTWLTKVKPSIAALMEELNCEFGPLRTFRPNRDVRFSKDKSPYKTWVGITNTDRATGGIGCFMSATASELQVAGGAMRLESDQLSRYREAIVSSSAGDEMDEIRQNLVDRDLDVGPGEFPVYKRFPAAYDANHPRAEMLLWKGVIVIAKYDIDSWVHTPHLADQVREVWGSAQPLLRWIDHHVGQSSKPASRR